MEIFLGIAVIIMLLLCLGAELGLIAMIFVGVLCGAVLLMLGFFVFSAVRIMSCHKREAIFCKTEKFPGTKFDRAVYSVDGEECACVFPCEVVSAMQNGGFGASLDTMRRLRFIPSVSVTGNATVIAAVPDYCYIDTINGKEPKKALIAIDYSDCDFGGTDGIVPKILL